MKDPLALEAEALPDKYTLREVAVALSLNLPSVRGFVQRRRIRSEQPRGPYTTRYVPLAELRRFEAEGLSVDWWGLLDAVQE